MRTITFEVEVDDKIFDTMVPSIYDDAVKKAPDGRLFLCKDKTSVAKKLVRLNRDVTAEGGNEAPWFENIFLPEDMRIVKITTHNDRPADVIPEGLIETDGKTGQEQPHSADAAPDAIPSSTLHDDHRAIIETISGLSSVIDLINANVLNLMENQKANRDGMYAKFEEAFKHFKQVHEEHNGESKHLSEAENRMTKRLLNEIRDAANTANTVGHDILHALPELEDRIKEYIGEPDPAQASSAGNAPSGDGSNQVLLRALDLLATVIKK